VRRVLTGLALGAVVLLAAGAGLSAAGAAGLEGAGLAVAHRNGPHHPDPSGSARQCSPSTLSASLQLTKVGTLSTSLAGALVFGNRSVTACTLAGVPAVSVVSVGGAVVPVHELASTPHVVVPAVLSPGRGSPAVGVSVTWSEWVCSSGSFFLAVRFPGWPAPLTVPYGTTAHYTGSPCTSTPDQTLYVGPVAAVGH
jgi:hypothetical protein